MPILLILFGIEFAIVNDTARKTQPESLEKIIQPEKLKFNEVFR